LSRLFISHSSRNDDWALALQAWLTREGWGGEHDIFLDFDPERGIAAGRRWARELEDAATRCEAVLFLVSEIWLDSKWCVDEYQLANSLNKKLFALLIDDIPLDRLPGGLTAQWQVVSLKGEPAERFLTVHPRTQHQSPVHIADAALKSLKRGLDKAGIGPETFTSPRVSHGGWGGGRRSVLRAGLTNLRSLRHSSGPLPSPSQLPAPGARFGAASAGAMVDPLYRTYDSSLSNAGCVPAHRPRTP
jgi:TIR domain-containing protein